MIEPTDEMDREFARASGLDGDQHGAGSGIRVFDGLAAVLALVERDYDVMPKAAPVEPWRCIKCGYHLQACAESDCVDPAQCGDVWCAPHTPDGVW